MDRVNVQMSKVVLYCVLVWCGCTGHRAQEPKPCYNRFEYEYNVLEKIIQLENKIQNQADVIETLTNDYKGAEQSLKHLQGILENTAETADGNTYIRWGRTVCPHGAALVYNGYAAGSYYTHAGSGSNRLCLPTDPMWKQTVSGFQSSGRLFGSEYQVSDYPFWKHLNNQDAPCAVCRIPRSTVLMIPGRYKCYENFTLEYSGYLMSGYYGHSSSLDYICVDGDPETIKGGHTDTDGALLYMVESQCGSLKCPPYEDGKEITCAVCSYSPPTTKKV